MHLRDRSGVTVFDEKFSYRTVLNPKSRSNWVMAHSSLNSFGRNRSVWKHERSNEHRLDPTIEVCERILTKRGMQPSGLATVSRWNLKTDSTIEFNFNEFQVLITSGRDSANHTLTRKGDAGCWQTRPVQRYQANIVAGLCVHRGRTIRPPHIQLRQCRLHTIR